MIRVDIKKVTSGRETVIGQIEIANVDDHGDTSEYSYRFGWFNGKSDILLQRVVDDFPRLDVNVLGLLLAGLCQLTEKELTLDPGTRASDMERGQYRALPPLRR